MVTLEPFLELFRRNISAVCVDPHVVIPGHPIHRGNHHIDQPAPWLVEVDELPLVETIQRLRSGIIVRITLAADGTDSAYLSEPLTVPDRCVLDTPIGVVDKPFAGLARPDRHLQRVQRQIRVQIVSDLPPDDSTREQIENKRGIHPPPSASTWVISATHRGFVSIK